MNLIKPILKPFISVINLLQFGQRGEYSGNHCPLMFGICLSILLNFSFSNSFLFIWNNCCSSAMDLPFGAKTIKNFILFGLFNKDKVRIIAPPELVKLFKQYKKEAAAG